MLPENTTTIEEYILAGANVTLSYSDLSFIDIMSNGTRVTIKNVINDYMDELDSITVKVRLTPEEYRKYRFKPKLLAYDLYGNTELYFVIMLLNDMIDIKDFDMPMIRLPKISDLDEMLTLIYNAELTDMSNYNSKKNTTDSDE